MKNLRKAFMILCFLVFINLLIQLVQANPIISVDSQSSFNLNDVAYFNYSITFDEDQTIMYIPYVGCPSAPMPSLIKEIIELKENVPYKKTYEYLTIDETIEPQTCTAYVQILSPIQKIVEKTFKIETSPSFEFYIELDKKVFTQGEDINLKYTSSIENPSIKSTLTLPDKSTQQLTLPTSITADQIGTYNLEVTASKQSYKTQIVKEQFGVIEKPAEIKSISACNSDGMCSEGENVKNCPQDCKTKDEKLIEKIFTKGPVLYTLLITIILIIVLFLGLYFKRKKEYNS